MRKALSICYGQIVVFEGALENPFNSWSERSSAQGFAYRPGSVSFRVPDKDGMYSVNILTEPRREVAHTPPDIKIVVPFTITSTCEFGSVIETYALPVSPGNYKLTAEIIVGIATIDLIFEKTNTSVLPIILAGPELPDGQVFFMNETPA